jgi:hypothetical protein
MRTQPLNMIAVVGLVACWGAVALAWLAGAIYYESRSPAEQTRTRFVSPMWISTVVVVGLSVAVPGQTGSSLRYIRQGSASWDWRSCWPPRR